MKLKDLEGLLVQHLQESGEIRADLKWLKKAFWTLTTAGISFNVALVTYLLMGGK